MPRRKHHKVSTFPKEVVRAVDKLVVDGHTYREITAWLNKLGHEITRSSVNRYGKELTGQLEAVKLVQVQTRAILDEAGGHGLEMEEAAVIIALEKIIKYLIDLKGMEKESAATVLTALARLQSSSVQREKLKIIWKEKILDAADEVKKDAKKSGLSEEKAEQFRNRIMGIAK